jgi:hypothetical protein
VFLKCQCSNLQRQHPKISLSQVVIFIFTPSEGLLAFLRQSSSPFENKNQGKNISKSLPWRKIKSNQFSSKAFKHQP